jgi:OmpA-OmpF porin, OOP family
MKIQWMLFLLLGYGAMSQDTKTLRLKNQLTNSLLDANLIWADENTDGIKRLSQGTYSLTPSLGGSSVIQISKNGYFDSNVNLAELKGDVQEVLLIPSIPQLMITIVDDQTSQPLSASIDVLSEDESELIFSESVDYTPYTIDLEYNEVHIVRVRKPGYFTYRDTINYKNVFEGRVRKHNLRLVPLKEGNKLTLNNIYFKSNSDELTDFAKKGLEELVLTLTKENKLMIEIGAHTDNQGSDEYNKSLSEKRAIAVKQYLLQKGVSEKLLSAKGYGESQPITNNETEEKRAMNRRVEFRILKMD